MERDLWNVGWSEELDAVVQCCVVMKAVLALSAWTSVLIITKFDPQHNHHSKSNKELVQWAQWRVAAVYSSNQTPARRNNHEMSLLWG